jgi:spoIIIJ-associated protein
MADENEAARHDEDDVEEQADAVADFVEELLAKMDIDAIAEPSERGGRVYVDIVDAPAEVMGSLIGRHGQTLDAIQELARQIVGRQLDQRIRVLVDVEDYRKHRAEDLEASAEEAAAAVLRDGGEVELPPMNALDRKIVHDALAAVDGVTTSSRGEDPERYVVVSPA